jgi:UDP-N-acetylglucosamine--N-acetylmuramyl-(pentapeptide) pyrophosphoryl-undecaprenol N-acetylglucosamine transferase
MAHRIILTGGGTGGHVYPALAVAEQLKKRSDVEGIIYLGVQGHIEEKLAKENGIDFVGLKVIGLPRKISPKLFTFPWHLSKAVWQARNIIKKFKPTAVLGTGGYAAAPALIVAVLKKIPIILHEPDSNPGLVNKAFAPHAQIISLGMAAAETKFKRLNKKAKIVLNGNPLAERFLHLPSHEQACQELGLDANLPVILVTGGSQGAQALNQAVYEMLSLMVANDNGTAFQIVHQVGDKNWSTMESSLASSLRSNPRYKPRKYFDNLAIAYAACDLSICRSGAMTIAELAATGTPAIFVPYPFAAADHQTFNARFVASKGAAKVIMQNDLTGQKLYQEITELLGSSELKQMRHHMLALAKPQAATTLAEQVLNLSNK